MDSRKIKHQVWKTWRERKSRKKKSKAREWESKKRKKVVCENGVRKHKEKVESEIILINKANRERKWNDNMEGESRGTKRKREIN